MLRKENILDKLKRFGKTGKPMAGKQSRQIKRNNCM